MKILAIETSCDETSIAIADFSGFKRAPRVRVLSHIVLSQIALHQKFGGVVPNLARREHEKNLVPILLRSFNGAGFLRNESGIMNYESWKKSRPPRQFRNSGFIIHNSILQREPELQKQFTKHLAHMSAPDIDAIAVTYGPGLTPALWVGVNFAKALAVLWKKPLIPVNHMEGHLFSALLSAEKTNLLSQIPNKHQSVLYPKPYTLTPLVFPALALLVSGGHTELVLVRGYGKYKIIGETLDDAAGEAFDKVARILGLGYPGGPAIAAETAKMQNDNVKLKIKLPRPMLNSKDYNFSFSGLKTAVLYLARDLKEERRSIKKLMPAIAKEFQDAVVDVLVSKTIRAAKEFKVKTILLGGGVSANHELRERLTKTLHAELPEAESRMPEAALSGDNAFMIALAAYLSGKAKAPNKIGAEANVKIDDIPHEKAHRS
ncbi:MAG: O-sialoglycoprotein endopeptidase [Parcubacteria group bacterium Gr01-1014_70]|nr:MAG: O-sialoglycoprotein endopeptidase [Parcubacteria group bacterium Gr01-1014_70]